MKKHLKLIVLNNCMEDKALECFFEVDAQHSVELNDLHNNLQFLLGIVNIQKVLKLVANLHEKR